MSRDRNARAGRDRKGGIRKGRKKKIERERDNSHPIGFTPYWIHTLWDVV